MDFVRISLPVNLASELVEDHVAVLPYETRGLAEEVLRLVINDVNSAASVVTVAIAADALRKFASRLWARSRKDEREVIRITVMIPGDAAPHELEVKRDDKAGEEKVLDFLISVLSVNRD